MYGRREKPCFAGRLAASYSLPTKTSAQCEPRKVKCRALTHLLLRNPTSPAASPRRSPVAVTRARLAARRAQLHARGNCGLPALPAAQGERHAARCRNPGGCRRRSARQPGDRPCTVFRRPRLSEGSRRHVDALAPSRDQASGAGNQADRGRCCRAVTGRAASQGDEASPAVARLLESDERLLADIGLIPADVRDATRLPIWRDLTEFLGCRARAARSGPRLRSFAAWLSIDHANRGPRQGVGLDHRRLRSPWPSWRLLVSNPWALRSAARNRNFSFTRFDFIGFRVARSLTR